MQTVSGFVDKINAAGGNAKVFVYPGEGHAFMNSGEKIKEKMKSEGFLSLLKSFGHTSLQPRALFVIALLAVRSPVLQLQLATFLMGRRSPRI